MSDLGAFILGITVASLICGPLYWYSLGEPGMITDKVKAKLNIVTPYDVYVSCYSGRVSHGWWVTSISVMDIDYGTKVSNLFRYNSDTGVLIPYGKLIGVEIRK